MIKSINKKRTTKETFNKDKRRVVKSNLVKLEALTNYCLFSGEMVLKGQTKEFTIKEADLLLKNTNCFKRI